MSDSAVTTAVARACIDGKAKPSGSLGTLEEWAVRLATLQSTLQPQIRGARLLLMAADHGSTQHTPGVSAYPRAVTQAMFGAIARGQAASNVLAAVNDCGVILVDVGVDGDVSSHPNLAPNPTTVLHRKVCAGTQPFNLGPAMTAEQCQQAMAAGAQAVTQACQEMAAAAAQMSVLDWQENQGVICVGELGIGNTTAAAALVAALCPDLSPADVCGRGTGVNDEGLGVKQAVVQQALAVNQELIQQGPLQALQAVGGLELAAMSGAFCEAARLGLPVVVDGYISGAAALVALRHDPERVAKVLFLSHQSTEAQHCGGQRLLQELGCGPPPLQLGFRLGEGTGAVLALPLLRSAAAIMSKMAALDDVLAAQ